jgi:3',5'-cyclic AMP phosphodiesterase CpdA
MRRATFLPAVLLALALMFPLLPAGAHAWSFAFTSDSHNDNTGLFARILAAVDNSPMEFLVHGGDMVNRDTTEEWERFRRATADFGKPFYPVIGNHDRNGGRSVARFAKRFGLPGTFYSFARRDARIWVVDNSSGSLPKALLSRLNRELSAHPKGKDGVSHLIVAMHIPPANEDLAPHGTRRGYDGESRKLMEILKRNRVDAVLCGHEHINLAEERDGVLVVVSSVSEFPLLPLQRRGFYRIDLEDGEVRAVFIPVGREPVRP